MKSRGFKPSIISYNMGIYACTKENGRWKQALALRGEMEKDVG